MNKLICTLLCILLMLNAYCQKKLAGEYRSNFAVKGFVTEDLSLLCDSTFVFTRSGDKQAFTVKGKWAFTNGHVKLTADTTAANPTSLFWGRWYFEGNKLFEYSAADYKQFVKSTLGFKDTSAKIIDIPEPNMAHYKNPDKFKLYYLKKVASSNCSGK